MKKQKFKVGFGIVTKMSYDHTKQIKPRRKQVKVTKPNQAMPVSEIVRRFASGEPLTGMRQPIYNGDNPVPDFDRMDLSEVHELQQETNERIRKSRNTQLPAPSAGKDQDDPNNNTDKNPKKTRGSGQRPDPAEGDTPSEEKA